MIKWSDEDKSNQIFLPDLILNHQRGIHDIFTCTSRNLVYDIIGVKHKLIYIGETKRA